MSSLIHPIYKRVDLWFFLACVLFFYALPNLDLRIAQHYYNGEFFFHSENPYVQFVNWLFARIHFFYLTLFVFFGLRYFYRDKHEEKKFYFFLVLCLVLSYSLAWIISNSTFGRPLPLQIIEFGGPLQYSAPFYPGECIQRCAFVSSHASLGFFIMAVAWVRKQKVWILLGCVLGITVGFVRMIQGTSFLSDVVFAGWLCWFVCVLLARKMKMPRI